MNTLSEDERRALALLDGMSDEEEDEGEERETGGGGRQRTAFSTADDASTLWHKMFGLLPVLQKGGKTKDKYGRVKTDGWGRPEDPDTWVEPDPGFVYLVAEPIFVFEQGSISPGNRFADKKAYAKRFKKESHVDELVDMYRATFGGTETTQADVYASIKRIEWLDGGGVNELLEKLDPYLVLPEQELFYCCDMKEMGLSREERFEFLDDHTMEYKQRAASDLWIQGLAVYSPFTDCNRL
jgi:hypothetical protein